MAAAVSIFAFSTGASAQLGSLSTDLVYTPITPCRVLDTRPSQGGTGPIAAGGIKNFQIWGATSYAFQGGAATNCGITAGADVAAVAMNVTVVTPSAGGFVTAYPFGAPLPLAATVNFQAGDIARGDFTIAKVAQTGTSHLSIYASSNADVVGDVVGYYSRPVATALQCVDVFSAPTLLPPGTAAPIYSPQCPAGGGFMTGGGCFRTPGTTLGFANLLGIGLTGSTHATNPLSNGCFMNNSHTTETSSVTSQGRCCAIPGRPVGP